MVDEYVCIAASGSGQCPQALLLYAVVAIEFPLSVAAKCLGKSGESEGNYVFPDADCSTLTTKIQ